MTIKEMETLSGMTRANIRFYESEGLLAPQRRANGYREYSEEDLAVLKRIRLLRSLHFSLEEIKAMQAGRCSLSAALDGHLERLQREKEDAERSAEICRAMRGDGAEYRTLDAERYLNAMEQTVQPEQAAQPAASALSADVFPEVHAPWRRFFARVLDYTLYMTLWQIFLALVLNINLAARAAQGTLLDTAAALLLMFLRAPLLLSRLGTTAGKALLGLRVTDDEGQRLTVKDARTRTWGVLFWGMGLMIPIYSLVRLWKSYRACSGEETLPWAYSSELQQKDTKYWRTAAYIAAHAALVGVLAMAVAMAAMPKHRGDITVAQFVENYTQLAAYYDLDAGEIVVLKNGGIVQSYMNGVDVFDHPVFHFTEENGVLTGVEFSVEMQGAEGLAPSCQSERFLAVLAFAKAQKDCGLFGSRADRVAAWNIETPFVSYSAYVGGVDVTCKIGYDGYAEIPGGNALSPVEGEEARFSMSFSLQKSKSP